MGMAKYKDIRGDEQEMKVLSRAKLTLFPSFNAERLSLTGSKMNGTHYWDCYLPADICKSL